MNETRGSFQYLNDRRKHVRVSYPCHLEYFLDSKSSEKLKAYVVDLSSGGICLFLPSKLSVGEKITIDSNSLPFMRDACRVCWIDENGDGNYMAGLEFCLP